MRSLSWSLVPVLLLAACPASVMPQYGVARDAALAAPGPLPERWRPDLIVELSDDLVADLVDAGVEASGGIPSEPISIGGIGTVTPDLEITEIDVSSGERCRDCVRVRASVEGHVRWKIGRNKGRTRVSASGELDLEVVAVEDDGEWTATLQPHRVRDLEVELGGNAASLTQLGTGPLEQWVKEQIVAHVPPYELGPYGSEDLPIRALRVSHPPGSLRLAMLTTSPTPTRVVPPEPPATGFTVAISQDSLLDLARREAFLAGPLSYDVVVEPTSLTMREDQFTMGMRLWRTKGRGWWRDYTVRGSAGVVRKGLQLSPDAVEEGERSPGAALVDPLAALGEGIILDTIQDAIATTVPIRRNQRLGSKVLSVRFREAEGEGARLLLHGKVVFTERTAPNAAPRSIGR